MKRCLAVGFSLFVGAVLGAGAVEALHAQATAPAFVITEVTVKNQARYEAQFVPAVGRTVKEAGGEVIVRGGKLQTLLGLPPASRVVVTQYPSFDAAQAWWNSPNTQRVFSTGKQYAGFRQFIVEGLSR